MTLPIRALRLSPLALVLAGTALRPQVPQAQPNLQVLAPPADLRSAAQLPLRPSALRSLAKAELLAPGKATAGTFHLNGLVTANKTVVLRWANTHGELPSEGVQVFRQKVGDKPTEWTPLLKPKNLVGLFRGERAKERIAKLQKEADSGLLDLFRGDLQYDPATRRRVPRLTPDPKAKRPKFDAEEALKQYRDLREQGRLAKSDLQLLHAKADTDLEAAELLGLAYEDKPGKGLWRYKIQVNLRGGGTAEAVCPVEFDPAVPTPVPAAQNLAAKSGNGAVYLSWEGPTSGIVAGYNVYRAEGPGGTFQKLNESPVKLVTLESEDPEELMRRASATEAAVEKEMRRSAGQPATEAKLREVRIQAQEAAELPSARAPLPAELSKSIQAGVASGRLPAKGLRTPSAAFVDSIRKARNGAFQNEHTYAYRITTVDISGAETPLASAPIIAGTPKDLEPPKVPGRPRLEGEAQALAKLREAQGARVKDARLGQLEQAVASRQPHQTVALAPYASVVSEMIPAATQPPPPSPAEFSTTTLGALRKMQYSRMVATAPLKELAEVAEAQLLHSNPDGSAPAARLVWSPSPDADLKSYEVWRATGDGPFQKVASVATAAWVDTSLEVGQSYRYQVSAVDQLGNESGRSDAGTVAVSDSRLKEKLAIAKVEGKPSTGEAPASVPGRSFLRPLGRKAMKVATLDAMRARVSPMARPVAKEPVVTAFVAPKTVASAKPVTPLALAPGAATATTFPALAAVEVGAKAPAPAAPWKVRARARSFNPMLVEPAPSKQIRVLLEWSRPLEGRPLEYAIYQAPQKMELKAIARPAFQVERGFRFAPAAPGSGDLILKGLPLQPAGPQMTLAKLPGGTAAPQTAAPAMVSTTAEHRAFSAKTLVGATGLGLRTDESRRTQRFAFQAPAGPGTFTRVNDAPVETERFVVTFPAEVAQYGGTTFYFRVQARTREFGRLVEGPLSEPVEVRLPDLVAPPAPSGGAANLKEVGDRIDVDLTWSAVPVPDLAGYVVERQTFDYTIVDGEAKPGAAQGQPQRLTPAPLAATSFIDPGAPGGYQRYTLRSVDKAGNVSEPQGHYDTLVPGEPQPQAPAGLSLAGNRLTWKPAKDAAGYTVWRSFTGEAGDYEQISGILGAAETGFNLPPQGTLHLKVVARSASGMRQTASEDLLRTP